MLELASSRVPRPFLGVLAALAIAGWTAGCASTPDRTGDGAIEEAPAEIVAEAAAAIRAAPVSLGLGPADPAGSPRILLGPMIGHTTDRAVRIWLQVDRPGRLEATLVSADGEDHDGVSLARPENGNVAIIVVDDLEPATRYTARFTLDGQPLAAEPPVAFRTFPRAGRPAKLRIALVSCARVWWDSLQPIWAAVERERPDVVLWLGDNNYFERGDSVAGTAPDYESLERMAYRHAQLRAVPSLQPVLRSIPNYAIWDDHDYGGSDTDRTFPLREGSTVLFTRYWANAYWGGSGLDGIWSQVRIGDVDIFLTDDRFWRDPNEAPASPAKTMLGPRQKAWLLDRLATSDARVKIVAVGSQVLADYHEWESFSKYAHERAQIMDWIHDRRVDGVVFVSGDRHLSELMRYDPPDGYPFYELTASPAANRPFVTGLEIPNPIRLDGYGAGFNFGLVDIDTTQTGGTIVFRILDVDGKEVFAHPANLDELRFPPSAR